MCTQGRLYGTRVHLLRSHPALELPGYFSGVPAGLFAGLVNECRDVTPGKERHT